MPLELGALKTIKPITNHNITHIQLMLISFIALKY